MQQSCTYGSVRGALGNRRPYRDKTASFWKIRNPHLCRIKELVLLNGISEM